MRARNGSRLPRLPVGAGELGANTVWATTASLLQFAFSALVVILLTNRFAPEYYGDYVGTLALVFFFSPFAGFGAPDLLQMRIVLHNQPPADAFALALGTTVLGGLAWTFLLVAARPVLLPTIPWLAVGAFAAAELVAIAVIDAAQGLTQALEDLRLAAVMRAVQGSARLGALVLLLQVDQQPDLAVWAVWYLVAGIGAAVVALALVSRWCGVGWRPSLPAVADLRTGTGLAMGWGTDRLRSDADKFLLARLSFRSDAGLYGAASRVLPVAAIPVRAVVSASMARFWRSGAHGGAATRLARRLVLPLAAYGLVAAAILVVLAPWVVELFGGDYGESATILRWLAPLPLLLALQALPATALTSEGHQRVRVLVMTAAVALNIVLNLVLIPERGWEGAVLATLVTEVLLAAALWAILIASTRSSGRTPELDSVVRNG